MSSRVIHADEYITPSVGRDSGSRLEWPGRERRREVHVAAEVGEKTPGFKAQAVLEDPDRTL
jgi:hypothetical protein